MTLEHQEPPDRSVSLRRGRSFLMGLAIVWIMFFHYKVALASSAFRPLNEFFSYGFFGVDVFFFLSAYGLCFSFHKDGDPGSFLRRRAKRILPFYLLNTGFLHLYSHFVLGRAFSFRELAGNLTFTGIYFGLSTQTNWYLQSIWLFYLLFPFLFAILVRTKRLTASTAALALFSLLLLPVVQGTGSTSFFIVCRIPSFLFGILFGIRALRRQKIPLRLELICYVLLIAGYILYTWACRHYLKSINANGLRWTLMIPLLFGILFLGCRVHHLLSRRKVGQYLVKAVEELGACSMELLVVHLLFRSLISGFFDLRLRERLLYMLISIAISIPLHRLIDFIVSRVDQWLTARKKAA